MLRTMKLRILAAALPVLLLGGCAASDPEPAETFVSASDAPVDPVAPATLGPLESDVMLVVRATANEDGGEPVLLELRVHRSTPWDDIAAQALPAAMTETCPDLTPQLFETELWSFTRVNVTALSPEVAGVSFPVVAAVGGAPVVARGGLVESGSPAEPCHAVTAIPAGTQGGLAIGIAGDSTGSTAWASGAYGFLAPDGVELRDCEVNVTQLGKASGGGSKWVTSATNGECITGSATAIVAAATT